MAEAVAVAAVATAARCGMSYLGASTEKDLAASLRKRG